MDTAQQSAPTCSPIDRLGLGVSDHVTAVTRLTPGGWGPSESDRQPEWQSLTLTVPLAVTLVLVWKAVPGTRTRASLVGSLGQHLDGSGPAVLRAHCPQVSSTHCPVPTAQCPVPTHHDRQAAQPRLQAAAAGRCSGCTARQCRPPVPGCITQAQSLSLPAGHGSRRVAGPVA